MREDGRSSLLVRDIDMKKGKPAREEEVEVGMWRKALADMDATLEDAQTCVRQLERVVCDLQSRVGNA